MGCEDLALAGHDAPQDHKRLELRDEYVGTILDQTLTSNLSEQHGRRVAHVCAYSTQRADMALF